MKKQIASYLGFLAVLSASMAADPACAEPVQWSGNGHWYEAVYAGTSGISWSAARDAAATAGGYLATSTSDAENNFIYSLVSEDKFWFWTPTNSGVGPWLGGYQYDNLAEPAGDWRWVTDEPWNYTNWANGEPNNDGGVEESLSFMAYGQLKGPTWNDNPNNAFPPDYVNRGYIIEFNSVPEPSTIILFGIGAMNILAYAWRRRKRTM